jgi:hypothetical protein
LAGVGVQILGAVLNMAPTKGPDSYHYYAYYGKDLPRAGLRGLLERRRHHRKRSSTTSAAPVRRPAATTARDAQDSARMPARTKR